MISRGIGSKRELVSFFLSDRSGAVLARGGVGSLALKLLHAGLTLTVSVLLARFLGPVEYGIYAFAFAAVTLLAIPVQMGLPLLVVRETAAGRAREDPGLVNGIWRWSARIVLIGSGDQCFRGPAVPRVGRTAASNALVILLGPSDDAPAGPRRAPRRRATGA